MEPKLINLGQIICKLTAINPKSKINRNVGMLLINPPVNIETDYGFSSAPVEWIEIYGMKILLKLSDEIRNYCEAIRAESMKD